MRNGVLYNQGRGTYQMCLNSKKCGFRTSWVKVICGSCKSELLSIYHLSGTTNRSSKLEIFRCKHFLLLMDQFKSTFEMLVTKSSFPKTNSAIFTQFPSNLSSNWTENFPIFQIMKVFRTLRHRWRLLLRSLLTIVMIGFSKAKVWIVCIFVIPNFTNQFKFSDSRYGRKIWIRQV